MVNQNTRFNRLLLGLMAVLYVVSLPRFLYANWMLEPARWWWILLVNALIITLPLVVFYGSAYLLISAWREHRTRGQLGPRLVKVIHWGPRAAAIAIIYFVSLFSFGVYEMEASWLVLLGAFILHSLPSIIMVVVLVFAWRRPVVGFVAFLLAGVFFLRFDVSGGGLEHFLLISGPLLLISALFYVDWRWLKAEATGPSDLAV